MATQDENAGSPSGHNPYASPDALEASARDSEFGDVQLVLSAVDILAKKRVWKVHFFAAAIRFLSEDEEDSFTIYKAEIKARIVVFNGLINRNGLHVRKPKTRLFQLTPEDFASYVKWKGPPSTADMRTAMLTRVNWLLPLGIYFFVTAIPVGGDVRRAQKATLGILYCLTAIAARVKPHRIFFLIEGSMFVLWAVGLIYRVRFGLSPWFLTAVPLCLGVLFGSIARYNEYADVRDE
jgi:hypothetical protein